MTRRKRHDPAECEWELLEWKGYVTDDDDRLHWEFQRESEEYSAASVGFRIKHERMKSGLTQQDVADAMGISTTTIVAWEKGYNDISLRDAHRLMMLFRKFPNDRQEWDEPSLNILTLTPMVHY